MGRCRIKTWPLYTKNSSPEPTATYHPSLCRVPSTDLTDLLSVSACLFDTMRPKDPQSARHPAHRKPRPQLTSSPSQRLGLGAASCLPQGTTSSGSRRSAQNDMNMTKPAIVQQPVASDGPWLLFPALALLRRPVPCGISPCGRFGTFHLISCSASRQGGTPYMSKQAAHGSSWKYRPWIPLDSFPTCRPARSRARRFA